MPLPADADRCAGKKKSVLAGVEWELLASVDGRRGERDESDDATASAALLSSSTTSTTSSTTSSVSAARCALEAYARLPPRGKPNEGEHTVMAAFVVEEKGGKIENKSDSTSSSSSFTAVAVATGSKCVGASSRSRRGDVVNDCHAEVLARRCLVRWMVAEMEKALGGGGEKEASSTSSSSSSRFFERCETSSSSSLLSRCLPRFRKTKPGWRLHLVTTQVPCGDACVRPGAVTGARAMTTARRASVERRTNDDANGDAGALHPSTPSPVPSFEGLIDVSDQVPGIARRKPGRGDSTLSMSCSDKLARWGCLGVQGSLLSMVLEASGDAGEGRGGRREERNGGDYAGKEEEEGEDNSGGGAIFIDEVSVVVADGGGRAERGEHDDKNSDALLTALALKRALADRTRVLGSLLARPFSWSPPGRLSVVGVSWRRGRGEGETTETPRSLSSSSPPLLPPPLSFNPLEDLGLDTSAAKRQVQGGSGGLGSEPLQRRRVPSGLALAWCLVKERNDSGNVERAEVLLGGHGCVAGFNRKQKKKRRRVRIKNGEGEEEEEEEEEEESRPLPPLPQLSKRAALERFASLAVRGKDDDDSVVAELVRKSTYRSLKDSAESYRRSWEAMVKEKGSGGCGGENDDGDEKSKTAFSLSSPLRGWIPKPRELEEFTLSDARS